jgi:hypothetical protein
MTKARSNAVAEAAKGDLSVGSGTNLASILAVGNNGETLVADSSTSTGLRYQSAYNGNAIINGGMDIWQRGTTFANPTVANYTADRFMINRTGDAAGATVSRSTSVPAGFQYAMQLQRTAGNTSTAAPNLYYGLESSDSYRFAGQTATLSFYAKAGANYSGGVLGTSIASGTATDAKPYGGTTTVATTNFTLTTSYQRFSLTGTFGSSITQAFINMNWSPTGTAGADDSVYITGIQLELGSVATTFKRAGGTIQGELAACQRYYWRQTGISSFYTIVGNGFAISTTTMKYQIKNPVNMRIAPTSIDANGIFGWDGAALPALSSPTLEFATESCTGFSATSTSLVANRPYGLFLTYPGAYIGFSAEL